MLAITLHEPYVWCFTDAGKRIENREWHPEEVGAKIKRGDYVALHAGKTYDMEAAIDLSFMLAEEDLDIPDPDHIGLGCVAAVARWWGVIEQIKDPKSNQHRWRSDTRFCFVFDEIWKLPTRVPARGYSKFWHLKPGADEEVAHQWGKVESPC